MKRLIFLLVLFTVLQEAIFSQSCLPEGITFTTQVQIDSFQTDYPDCTEIEGNVTINGGDITNLNGLNVITYIGGDLFIGTYEYGGNSVLTSLSGLEGLTSVDGRVAIFQNPVLTSLTGLENLTSVGHDLVIYSNPLNSLAGLANLTSVGSGLSIGRNYELTSLTGLDNLSSIGGSISISENDALISLTGLDNIDAASIDDLSIFDNSSLSSCAVQSICNYLSSPNGVISVFNNLIGCSTPPEIASGCGIALPCLPYGDYHFNTQTEIDNFQINYSECNYLMGNVEIDGNDIANLIGLEGVTFIGSNLFIMHCYALNSLEGLSSLTSVGGDLFIEVNDSLISLEGLDSLHYVGRDLYIGVNDLLTDLVGLDNLDSIGRDLDIVNNINLNNITGLTSLIFIGRHFTISGDMKLTSLTGLEGLKYIGGTLKIGGYYLGNQLLTSLAGLGNLTYVGHYINIINNHSLISLTGLDNIDTASVLGLYIYDNESLSTCEVHSVCDYLASPDAAVDIHSNATGCNSQEEVESACEVWIRESAVGRWQLAVNVFPNPSSTLITIETAETTPKFQLSIFNLNGQEVISCQITESKTVIDISHLPQGLYFARLTSDSTVKVLKMIKE
jgi:hypothetical protein